MVSSLFDFSTIYNDSFKYSLPEKDLKSYLSGNAFDYKKDYTEQELADLKQDIEDIFREIIEKNPNKERIAVLTAGAPGSGKTTLQKQILGDQNYAYICPDDVCLKKMERTFKKMTSGTFDERKDAYTKWRPGSNAGCHLILAHLILEGYGFYFGTTSSGKPTGFFLDFLKKQDYTIKLIHISSPDEERWKSIKERDKTFVQTTEEDVRVKGLLVPDRINDTYLKFADEIDFYYRSEFNQDAVLAAKWVKGEGLTVIDEKAYEGVKTIQNLGAKTLSNDDLLWENSVLKTI